MAAFMLGLWTGAVYLAVIMLGMVVLYYYALLCERAFDWLDRRWNFTAPIYISMYVLSIGTPVVIIWALVSAGWW